MQKYDLTGQCFGNLTVIKKDKTPCNAKNSKWICQCKCGKIISIFRSSLVFGHSKSCGCTANFGNKNAATHDLSNTRIYEIWINMRKRCHKYLERTKQYYGMEVYKPWDEDFMSFYNWSMENGYTDELTIDRIDNSKGYTPDNCRWVTKTEQQRNKTNNIKIAYNGEIYCLKTLCDKIGFPYKLAHARYRRMLNRNEEVTNEKLFAPVKP